MGRPSGVRLASVLLAAPSRSNRADLFAEPLATCDVREWSCSEGCLVLSPCTLHFQSLSYGGLAVRKSFGSPSPRVTGDHVGYNPRWTTRDRVGGRHAPTHREWPAQEDYAAQTRADFFLRGPGFKAPGKEPFAIHLFRSSPREWLRIG
jgi:hypothetical protein